MSPSTNAERATFTPGPWRSVELGSEGAVITPECGDKRERLRWIAKVSGRDTLTDFANGRLLAAAPELYWALKQALEFIRITSDQGPELHQTTWEKQYAAIAKAERR